jgi:hypothetical protein
VKAPKRYFPIPYLIIGTVAVGHIISHLVRTREAGLAWIGALIAIVPLVSFMLSLAVVKRARTLRNQYPILALAVIGTVLSFIGFESPPSWYALFLGLIPSFVYVFWYSKWAPLCPRSTCAARVRSGQRHADGGDHRSESPDHIRRFDGQLPGPAAPEHLSRRPRRRGLKKAACWPGRAGGRLLHFRP